MPDQNESAAAIALAKSTPASSLALSRDTNLLLCYLDEANRKRPAFMDRVGESGRLKGERIATLLASGVEEAYLNLSLALCSERETMTCEVDMMNFQSSLFQLFM